MISRPHLRVGELAKWWPAAVFGLCLGLPGLTLGLGETNGSLTPKQEITQAACAFLERAVTAPHDSLAVALDLPALPDAGGGITDYSFELLSSKAPIGTVNVKITLFMKDGSTLPVVATARVRIYDQVCVAARRFDRHECLSRDGIRVERREVTSLTDGYYSDVARVVGKQTRRIISAGSLLEASDIQDIPLVARGSGVMVSVAIGAVTVIAKGRALEDGDLGQVIMVEYLATGKRLSGTVVGKGLVALEG
ncbi:MAG TPA: flagellar basal body P-ring formation chaperone FlgA [bacterium]|nr:flagellar basal body P-ring formation chaperone FlgA [bacterium]